MVSFFFSGHDFRWQQQQLANVCLFFPSLFTAGGQAVDNNMKRVLDVHPEHIHDKSGIFMGSYDEVEKVKAFYKK